MCGAQLTDRKDREIHSESNVWGTAQTGRSTLRAMCGAQLTDRKDRDIHSESNVWCTAHRQGDPQ